MNTCVNVNDCQLLKRTLLSASVTPPAGMIGGILKSSQPVFIKWGERQFSPPMAHESCQWKARPLTANLKCDRAFLTSKLSLGGNDARQLCHSQAFGICNASPDKIYFRFSSSLTIISISHILFLPVVAVAYLLVEAGTSTRRSLAFLQWSILQSNCVMQVIIYCSMCSIMLGPLVANKHNHSDLVVMYPKYTVFHNFNILQHFPKQLTYILMPG